MLQFELSSAGATERSCAGLTLPKMGRYLLVACATDSDGWTVSSHRLLGKTEEEWTARPLAAWNPISVSFDKVSRNLFLN